MSLVLGSPMPLSHTANVQLASARAADTRTTGASRSWNLSALAMRFWNTRDSANALARTVGSSATSTVPASDEIWASRPATTSPTTTAQSTSRRFSLSLSAVADSRIASTPPRPRLKDRGPHPACAPDAVAHEGQALLLLRREVALATEQAGEEVDGRK